MTTCNDLTSDIKTLVYNLNYQVTAFISSLGTISTKCPTTMKGKTMTQCLQQNITQEEWTRVRLEWENICHYWNQMVARLKKDINNSQLAPELKSQLLKLLVDSDTKVQSGIQSTSKEIRKIMPGSHSKVQNGILSKSKEMRKMKSGSLSKGLIIGCSVGLTLFIIIIMVIFIKKRK